MSSLQARMRGLLDPDSVSSDKASGKSDQGGVLCPPFGIAAGEFVSVILVDPEAFGSDLCGGRVGSGSTFCLVDASLCSVAAHSTKIVLSGIRAGSAALVIRSPGKDSKAFSDPVLDSMCVAPDELSDMLANPRPVEEWKLLFNSCAALPDSKRPQLEAGFSTQPAFTPRKPKHRYLEVDESGSPSSWVQLPETEDLPWPADPPSEETWPAVTAHWNDIKANVRDTRTSLQASQLQTGKDIDRLESLVDVHHVHVKDTLGERPKNLPASIWATLGQHEDSLVRQGKDIDKIDFPEDYVTELEVKKLTEATILEIMENQVIPHFRKEMGKLGGGRASSVTFEDQDEEDNFVRLSRTDFKQLKKDHDELQSIKANVDRLRESVSGDTISMGAHSFGSAYDCAMFLEKHDAHASVINMYDIVSLLQAACFGNEGTRESLDFDQKASKSSYKSAAEAIYVKSFGLSLPEIFGKVDTAQTASKRGLPGVKTFRDWDAQCEQDGLVHYIQDCVNKFILAKTEELGDSLSPVPAEVRNLALVLLTTSNTWLISMVGFVTKYYHDLFNGGDSTTDEAWSHVSQVKRVMFKLICAARTRCSTRIDGSYDSKRRAPALLWGTLKAHKEMKDFIDAQFQNHPAVAPVLTRHLFAHRQSKVAAKASDDKIKSLESSLKNLKSAFDKKPWKS